jgi:hypothetical protein
MFVYLSEVQRIRKPAQESAAEARGNEGVGFRSAGNARKSSVHCTKKLGA